MRFFLRSIDLLFIMRPLLLIPVWGFAVFGYWNATGGMLNDIQHMWRTTPFYPFLFIVIFSLSVGAVYIFNQIADIEVDKKNGGLPLIASGIISKRLSIIFAALLSLFSICIPILFSEPVISVLSMIAICIGAAYSFKPTFFSGRPFLDFLSNATGYGIVAYAVGWHLGGKAVLTVDFCYSALPYFLLMASGSICSTFPDLKGDKAEGKCTTTVFLGIDKAHILATLFLCIASFISIYNKDIIALVISLACLPIYLLFTIIKTEKIMESTYKVGGVLCMAGSIAVFPLLFPAAIVVFIMTWLYFRLRHGVTYPSLTVVHNDS